LKKKTNKAITIDKFNFSSNQTKLIMVKGEQVEHVEYTIYLFHRKSRGL